MNCHEQYSTRTTQNLMQTWQKWLWILQCKICFNDQQFKISKRFKAAPLRGNVVLAFEGAKICCYQSICSQVRKDICPKIRKTICKGHVTG